LSALARDALLRSAIPAVLLVLVAMAAGIAGYATAGGERKAGPPPIEAGQRPFLRGVVQSISGDRLTLATDNGPLELRLAPSTTVEALRPFTLERVRPGDWLNAGAVSHQQTLFALVGIVLIPPSQLEAPR
jgi:hypothetical protein